ncbi:MAG: PBECR2 nuclease fold domain-containing protein [Oscillospiraceae bacterium]|nr:PBECR2 nuclease fold domain-containing protein [Oscillospiraceae bacterium]
MYKIGEINLKHFEGIHKVLTPNVIITETQIEHIKERHPNDYERYFEYIPAILEDPDYIIEANKPNTSILLKSFSENGKNFQLILRLKASTDPESYENSIITFMKVNEKRYERHLRTKKILYKSE